MRLLRRRSSGRVTHTQRPRHDYPPRGKRHLVGSWLHGRPNGHRLGAWPRPRLLVLLPALIVLDASTPFMFVTFLTTI